MSKRFKIKKIWAKIRKRFIEYPDLQLKFIGKLKNNLPKSGYWYKNNVKIPEKFVYDVYPVANIYSKNIMIYFGETKYNKRHGMGIENDLNGLISYKGDWENNYRHGMGIQYKYGQKVYEGSWNCGKPHGIGILYHPNSTISYKGHWNNGQKHGEGIEYYTDGTVKFIGQYESDQPHKGNLTIAKDNEPLGDNKVVIMPNNDIYIGQTDLNNLPCGFGALIKDDIVIYRGKWKDGKMNGYGQKFYNTGELLYEGYFVNNLSHGTGKAYKKGYSTPIYSGQFENNVYGGMGILFYNNSTQKKIEGQFKNDYPYGNIVEYYKNGKVKIRCEAKNGYYNGKGVIYHSNGKKSYEGQIAFGYFCGYGIKYSKNGVKIYEGTFENSKYNGQGILYEYPNMIIGRFTNSKMNGNMKIYRGNTLISEQTYIYGKLQLQNLI